ncbi:hypothetical protein [Tropicimonas sp.]|uniref:hypothetical protein n=1 Tax=Tropicimonas sp. TaxID=2067044 RepID=UPI003A86DDBD
MTEDFALIDFALTDAAPEEVAIALGRARSARGTGGDGAGRRSGILGRLFHRRGGSNADDGTHAPLLIQPAGTLGGPIIRQHLADTAGAGLQSDIRLTSPVGTARLTLLEYRDTDDKASDLVSGLSAGLPGHEIFSFRHSGNLHPGAHFGFHVHLDGRCTRRAESVSSDGTSPEAVWTGTDSGMPHPFEADSLPAPGIRNSEIMTPIRQGSILESMGVDPDALFGDPDPGALVLELSAQPGGLPVSEAPVLVARGRQPAAAPASAPQPGPPPRPMPWEAQHAAPSWEEEVTGILVTAVEAALPADRQIPWLEHLTSRLESGQVDEALTEARQVIDAGHRPQAEKDAAIRRLSELFGKSAAGGAPH